MSCTSTKQDQDISSTIPKEIINNQEKDTFPMLPKIPFEEKSIPSLSCSTSPYPLQNCVQALSAPIKNVTPIKAIHESIDGFDHVAHSKDVDIPFHYPFASPKSILGPYPSKLKP